MSDSTGTGLDTAVDEVARRMRTYVEVARGVRAEFSPEQADLDPRVEDVGDELGRALRRFTDAFEAELGFIPHLETVYDNGPTGDDPSDPLVELAVDEFRVALIVGVEGGKPDALDTVLPIIDDATNDLVHQLLEQGFEVPTFSVSRGLFDDGFETDDEEAP